LTIELRQKVIEEARSWIGTPFHHQAKLKGYGCDCVGLILGVGATFGFTIEPHRWEPFRNYARAPNPRKMTEAMNLFLNPISRDEVTIADVLFLEWRKDMPMHLAIVSEDHGEPTLIHALMEMGKVIEHGSSSLWEERVTSCWRYPFLEN
jgi:NlpC/P60 family putative phage cell wall peptidase